MRSPLAGLTEAGGRWYRDGVPTRLRENLRSLGGRGLAVATIWNGAGTMVARGAQILAMVLAARILGPPKFGALGILLSTLAAVQTFAGLALGGTITKYISQFRPVDSERAGRVLAIGLVLPLLSGSLLALGIVFLSPTLSHDVMRDESLIAPFRVLSLVVVSTGLFEALAGAMAGLHAFRRIALANASSGAVTLPAVLVGALSGGLDGVVWALVGSGVTSCVAMGLMLRAQLREDRLRMRFVGMWQEFPLVWRFALPSLLVGATSMPVTWLCQTLLLRRHGYVEVALFTAANNWYGVMAFLPAVFGGVILPRLSESYGMGNRYQLNRLSVLGVGVNACLAGAIGLVLVAVGPLLMRAYGPGFSRGTLVLDLAVACAGVTVIQSAVGQGLAAVERMWGIASCNLAWAGTFVAATFAYVDHGAVGLALARLLAQLLYFVCVIWLYQRHVAYWRAGPG